MLYNSNDMYSRLIKAFTDALFQNCEYIDLVNFNRNLFKDVLPIGQIETIFNPSYGYGAPDGSSELTKVVHALEKKRSETYRNWLTSEHPDLAKNLLEPAIDTEDLAVGSGIGTTGVMGVLLKALIDFESNRPAKADNVVLCVPNYSVYDGIINGLKLKSNYLETSPENGFLPTFESFLKTVNEESFAVVLTYPNNPAQTTYTPEKTEELKKIVQYCQKNKIYLIVDNIYQDTIWNENVKNPEIFTLTDSSEYIFKVFGASKDRAFYSGLRMGYYIGDKRIAKAFFYHSSLTNNTHNNQSSLVFAVDLLFRYLLLGDKPMQESDIQLLDTYVAGWGIRINTEDIFNQFQETKLFENYCRIQKENDLTQKVALEAIIKHVSQLEIIEESINGGIGNVLLLKVNSAYFDGSCQDFFEELLNELKLGVLPGNVFGLPEERGNAWFRITVMHEEVPLILEKLDRINQYYLEMKESRKVTSILNEQL